MNKSYLDPTSKLPRKLYKILIKNSDDQSSYHSALSEWEIIPDETLTTNCLCGKPGIKHVHAVKNKFTKAKGLLFFTIKPKVLRNIASYKNILGHYVYENTSTKLKG